MSEIRERAKSAQKEMSVTGWDRWANVVTDLLAELERVEKERDDAMREASSLAKWLHKTYYALTAPDWSLCDTPAGVITQIDNMVTGIPDLVHSRIKDRIAELEAGEDAYRCVKCGAIYLDSPVSVCDCAHDATEFRLCKLVDPKLQEAPK